MKQRHIPAIFLVIFMFLASITGIASRVSAEDVTGSKSASPVELSADERTTKVTLSLPSGEYQNKADIVFVMDNSTSIKNAGFNFTQNVRELLDQIVAENEGIDLKVGVVKFRGYATDMIGSGLAEYSSRSEDIIDAIDNNDVPGRGSNIHSGMILAEQLLSADSEVPDGNKYVILLTDGKSYIWNNDDNEPVMYYSQSLKGPNINSGGLPVVGQVSGSANRESGASYAALPYAGEPVLVYNNGTMGDASKSADYYQWLYDSGNAELSDVNTEYDFPCYYAGYYEGYSGSTGPEGTVNKIVPANGTEVFPSSAWYRTFYEYTPDAGSVWEDLRYLSVSPYELTTDSDGNVLFDTDNPDADFFLLHPDTLQKGVYQAGHYWKETIDEKYHSAAITLAPEKVANGSGLHIAGSFSVWLRENSDLGAVITESDAVAALFEDLDNSIRYMAAGGTVTDEIPDAFALVMPDEGAPFAMTLGGEPLAAVQSGDGWCFGEPDESGNYPYAAQYDEETGTITWNINVPVENLRQVTLSYDLLLDENSENGTYDTNRSAVFNYSSTDKKEGTFTFEVPKVTYNNTGANDQESAEVEIAVRKVWHDSEDEAGLRPDSVDVTLLADGEQVETVTIKESDHWEYTFRVRSEDSAGNEITYTIIECAVDNYESKVTGDAESGFEVVNSLIPSADETKPDAESDSEPDAEPDPESEVKPDPGTETESNPDPVTETEPGIDAVESYSESINGSSADGVLIQNTHEPSRIFADRKPGSPGTGDDNSPAIWIALLLGACLVICCAAFVRRKHRG